MNISRIRRFSQFSGLIFVLVAQGLAGMQTVSAQEPVPDIRGNYELFGTQAVTGCADFGVDFTSPLAGTLQITSQDGSRFVGVFGFPSQGADFFTFSGNVAADGSFEGTWDFPASPGVFQDQLLTGHISGANADAEFTATYGTQGVACDYRASLASIAATLSWMPPDPASTAAFPPPRALTLSESQARRPHTPADEAVAAAFGFPPEIPERAAAPGAGAATGYKVYRSSSPNVSTTSENLFAQVPPSQTSLPTGASASGSFFVVTTTYAGGESQASNEVSGGLKPATVTNVKVTSTKIKANGDGFTSTVLVFVDGIPFASGAKVKGGKKVTQKGALITGQTLGEYLTPGKVVAITFRNADGAIATWVYTKP